MKKKNPYEKEDREVKKKVLEYAKEEKLYPISRKLLNKAFKEAEDNYFTIDTVEVEEKAYIVLRIIELMKKKKFVSDMDIT